MKLYENVAIGNFLYGLGFAVAKRVKGQDLPSIVNLLQQTPDDPLFGDVLIRAPGVLRIFEFKQRDNTDSKEPARHAKLVRNLAGKDDLIRISRIVHWFVETAPAEKTFFSRIVPYLDAYPKTTPRHDFAEFVNATAVAVAGGAEALSQSDMANYLAHLVLLHKTGTVGSGGLVVKMSETGELHYAELASILDLILTRQAVIEEHRQQEQALKREKANEQKLDRGPRL
ncbi:hypothetical protein OPU71_20705 [Niveibacterium sp. 24ML]|uniref:hypothetical protein n=1 Tax=Niveibacterium sp. 24ML TaxID=2985512 RepID=UPI00226EFCFB|nr:hypothetical protein [Niveibacterium sp. 24ML]MCX9158550.1 hypothetical protein [Niveibacterium sp. 24ML]